MNPRYSLPIRSQMIILIVVMSLAPLGIIIFTAVQEYKHDKQISWVAAERLCNDIDTQQKVLLSGAEQLLSSLAYIPSIQNRDAKEATALITELARKNPGISNIFIADTTGRMWASTVPMCGEHSVSERRYFRNAMATGNFSSGEFAVGKVLQKPVISFGYPIRNASGKIRDIAIVAFTLDSYNHLLKMKKMPESTSLVLTDHKGTILFDAAAAGFIGKEDKRDIFRQLSEGADKGTFEGTGLTGKRRYYAYQKIRLGNEQAPYMYVRTGIQKESLVADKLVLNVGFMGLFTLLAICFAFFTSKRGIVDKVRALRDAALQVGNGNLSVKVSETVSGGELGELGRTFDEMAHRLADDLNKREKITKYLMQSEAKYRMLVETAYEGVWAVDEENLTTFVNPQMAAMLGYSKEEMLGYEPGWFVTPEDLHKCREQMTLLHQGSRARSELRFQRKDGSITCLLASASPLLNSQGVYSGAFAMLHDISERKHAEAALHESNLLLEKTFASLKESIFIVETGTRIILDCNSTCEKMFGYTQARMIGATTEFLHVSEEMSKRFGNEMEQAYGEKGFYETVFVMKRKDGSVFDSEHSVTPIRNDRGEIARHVCVVRDISESRRMQRELEARSMFVESIFAHLKSGIIVVDHDYRTIMLNQYVAEFSKEQPEVFVGRNLSDICPELHDALVSGLTAGEIPVTLFNNSQVIGFTKLDLNSAYMDSSGYIINFKDLTEIIKIRRELRHRERLSAMGEVVASVAHEMRNPLFAISSIAQILEMELSLSSAQKELLASLLKESRRINHLVEELLDSTRELRLQRKTVDLNGIVAASLLVLKSISDEKGIHLKNSSFAEQIMIHADSNKLEQVLINLVKNAIEASSRDSLVELTIEEGVGEVVISITDSGAGIAPEVFEKIFDVFFTTKRGGTGLGLSICRNIIEAHDGTLTASNNPGIGATFTARLPFAGDNR